MGVCVYISVRNQMLNKLFHSVDAQYDLTMLNRTLIEQVLALLGFVSAYDVIFSSWNGQYIIVETPVSKTYVMFSGESSYNTRNGYLVAKLPLTYFDYLMDDTKKQKSLFVCLLDINRDIYEKHKDGSEYMASEIDVTKLVSESLVNGYQIFAYRLLQTLNIQILNAKFLPFTRYWDKVEKGVNVMPMRHKLFSTAFGTVEELIAARVELLKKNSGNNSSYFIDTGDSIYVYAKCYGNNGFEATSLICALHVLALKEQKVIYLFELTDHGAIGLSNTCQRLLAFLKIGVVDAGESSDVSNSGLSGNGFMVNEKNDCVEVDETDCRNQGMFMKNLATKWLEDMNVKKCYLCGCTIQKAIIASHIHRVCDINKLNIPFEEKKRMAIDGNNGFWLCATHDKMFEYGIITFNEFTGEFVLGSQYLGNEALTDEQKQFIDSITSVKGIDKQHFTDELQHYLKVHNDRIRNLNFTKD